MRDLIAQRLYGLCCGYEDLNDHDRLRHDPLLQAAVGKVEPLVSSPTFSRLENRASRADLLALNQVLVEQFIASQANVPAELILESMRPTCRCTATRNWPRFTATTINIVICRCMSFAAKPC